MEKWGKGFHALSKFTKGLNVPTLTLCWSVIGWGQLHPHCVTHKDLQLLFPVVNVLSEPGTSITGSLNAYEIYCFLNQSLCSVRQLK